VLERGIGPPGFSIVEEVGSSFMQAEATVEGSVVIFRAAGFTRDEFFAYLESMRAVPYSEWQAWLHALPAVEIS
jgi:hypothetical protein